MSDMSIEDRIENASPGDYGVNDVWRLAISAGDEIRALRAELEECREDAEKWCAHEARKRAVIDAGMGKIILRDAARKGEGEVC